MAHFREFWIMFFTWSFSLSTRLAWFLHSQKKCYNDVEPLHPMRFWCFWCGFSTFISWFIGFFSILVSSCGTTMADFICPHGKNALIRVYPWEGEAPLLSLLGTWRRNWSTPEDVSAHWENLVFKVTVIDFAWWEKFLITHIHGHHPTLCIDY